MPASPIAPGGCARRHTLLRRSLPFDRRRHVCSSTLHPQIPLTILRNESGALLAAPFVHLTVDSAGERGLLGVTHGPNFANDHFVYVYHTVPAAGSAKPFNEITRYTAAGDLAAAGSAVDVLKLNDLSSA